MTDSTAPAAPARRIEYLRLQALKTAKRNPRQHKAADIGTSLGRFGAVEPMVQDGRTGRLVAGHGRKAALLAMKRSGQQPPDGVQVDAESGDWLVPVLCGWASRSDTEAEAYLLASNGTAGTWDDAGLAQVLADLAPAKALDGLGFGTAEVDRLLAMVPKPGDALAQARPPAGSSLPAPEQMRGTGVMVTEDNPFDLLGVEPSQRGGSTREPAQVELNPPAPRAEPDAEREARGIAAVMEATPRLAKAGDVWRLGRHTLLVGDSTQDADVDRLLRHAGGKPAAVITDPPFAIFGSASGLASDITDDKMTRPFFEAVLRQCARVLPLFAHVYLCCDWRSWASIWETSKRTGLVPKNMLVWDKGGSGLGSMWANGHELVWFGVREPARGHMRGDEQTGHRQVYRPNILRFPRPHGTERMHNAAKPVDMMGLLVEAATDPGALVLELFTGSGSTLMACDKLDRTCAAMEVDPRNADVVLARWLRDTGQQPERVAQESEE